MKLSFSIPTKSTSKPKFSAPIETESGNKTARKEFVTEFDPSKSLTQTKPDLIIPPKENEWRPHKKLKNLALLPSLQSSDSDSLRFEVATDADDGDDKGMSYGLNIRYGEDGDGGNASKKQQQQQMESSTENILLEKLRYDLQRLPDDRGFEEFEDVPVEGFGAALLAGYGWREGRGIGRNAKEDVKVKQYSKRTDKEGLGFVTTTVSSTDHVKDRDSINDNSVKVSRNNENKRGRESDGFFVGKDVRVIADGRGIYGLKGRILERLNADWVVLKVGESQEEVKLRVTDIADLGSKEEDKCLRKLRALQLESQKPKDRDSGKDITELSNESRESMGRDRGQVKGEKNRWLRNHIRVRIISKDLKGGRFYLKKGEVIDVVGPHVCDISMDETKELIQGIDQDLLETALPRRGGPVLVLYGKHKGVYGNLIEKNLDRETGVVQDSDTHEYLNVKLEQIAEYVGDPSYIGY